MSRGGRLCSQMGGNGGRSQCPFPREGKPCAWVAVLTGSTPTPSACLNAKVTCLGLLGGGVGNVKKKGQRDLGISWGGAVGECRRSDSHGFPVHLHALSYLTLSTIL